MSSEDVYIVGIDMIKFGKFLDRSVESLGAEAALGALDDAGVTIQDIQALYSGNLMQASGMVGQRIQQQDSRHSKQHHVALFEGFFVAYLVCHYFYIQQVQGRRSCKATPALKYQLYTLKQIT